MSTPPPAATAATATDGASPRAGSKSLSPKQPTRTPSPQTAGQAPLVAAEDADDDDADSLGDTGSTVESTASIASSILNYRTISGRTFHSDRHEAEYFTPNDQQQGQAMDIYHHVLLLLLGGKLQVAPISDDVQNVLDIGTGTGIWAMDFADEHPQAEVIGTDLSPIQPQWVPPNLKFEIDDCTKDWTFQENHFDFVHIRYLFGAIADWGALFRNAYRCCKPGGWMQSSEAEVIMLSDDGTVSDSTTMATTWNKLFREAGQKLGQSFLVISDNVQRKAMEEAGFTDIQEVTYKVPMNGWPKDPKLSEIGRYVQLTMDNDIEGYTMYLWNHVMGWPQDEYQMFLMLMRKEIRSRKIHSYFYTRYVYGRKPAAGAA